MAMKSLVLISVALIQSSWSYGSPDPDGAGAFAYEDSAGHSYRFRRFLPPLKPLQPLFPFKPLRPLSPLPRVSSPFHWFPPLPPLNRPRDVIFSNIENQQRAAFEAAQNSFGAFNAFPHIPNFDFRFSPYDHYNNFGPRNHAPFAMSGMNSAFAAGAVGPGFRHQIAAINPANAQSPNVDTSSQYPTNRDALDNRFYSVSSSSYSSSVDKNGKQENQRGAETVVNDNGKVTKYSVHS